ncbi:MAG: rane protein [Thermomicrobiales bacterium]|nr:rane protein [Thermomicrobiales bacterium]
MTERQSPGRGRGERGGAVAETRGRLGSVAAAVAGAGRGFVRDDGPLYAAALAYYALFSLFPLLLVAAVVYASLVPEDRVVSTAARLVHGYVPDRTVVERTVSHAVAHRGQVGAGALVFLLLGASRLFDAVVTALNRAAQAPKPSLRKRALQEAVLTLGAGAAAVAILGLTALGRSDAIQGNRLGAVLASHAPPVLTFLGVAALYRFVPNRPMTWSDVWAPALGVALFQEALQRLFFAWVQQHYARYDAVYGSLGVAVVALLWLYANAALFLLGAEAAAGQRAPVGELAHRAAEAGRTGSRLARRLGRATG